MRSMIGVVYAKRPTMDAPISILAQDGNIETSSLLQRPYQIEIYLVGGTGYDFRREWYQRHG
jgi:hypothetical protein